MNVIEKTCYLENDMYKNQQIENKTYKKCAVDLAATLTTVACYYPLRTIGARWMKGLQSPTSFKGLYSGFGYGCLGAHQLFLMTYFNQMFKAFPKQKDPSLISQIGIGIVSGILSTPTTTPLEAKILWMQQKAGTKGEISQAIQLSSYFRGWIPLAIRQMGLSLGMFVFPELIQKKMVSNTLNNRWTPIVSNILGGFCAVVLTHIPELARMKMQTITATPLSTNEALSSASKEAFSTTGKKIFLLRLGVLITATAVMNGSKNFYSKKFN